MKNIKTLAIATVLSALSFGAFAADYVSPQQGQQMEKIGVVSSRAADLSSLKAQLAEKADKAGAKAYTITNASGNDNLFGTAIIYN